MVEEDGERVGMRIEQPQCARDRMADHDVAGLVLLEDVRPASDHAPGFPLRKAELAPDTADVLRFQQPLGLRPDTDSG